MLGNIFIKRTKLAIVISLVIFLAGLISLFSLPLEEYPSITPPQVIVTAKYSGASADVIASTIAAPVELQLNGIQDLLYMSSESTNGVYKLTLFFEVGSDPDMDLVNVQNQLQLVQPRLPEEVRRYGLSVKKTTGGAGCLMVALKSPNKTYDSLFLANYASMHIKDELARIKGCGGVQIFGAGDYSMRIWLKPDIMASLGVSVKDVSNAIKAQNTQTPAGEIGVEPLSNHQMIKYTLRTKGRLKTVNEFENIIIKSTSNGANIKIKDIARVELGAESYSSSVNIGKADAAMISISQLPEANTIDLVNKIKSKMLDLSQKFPKDMEYDIQYDATEFVRESIKEVIYAIILAIVLVGIVSYLFLGSIRASIIPFCAIPVSLVGVFIFMAITAFSINLLILFGLVLAVGLVVDDAIVVLENTERYIQEYDSTPVEATEKTMEEVVGAVIATSLVLMSVFVPVSFLKGITGEMYRQFALCIATSIGLSTFVALTLSPALCSILLKRKSKDSAKNFLLLKFQDSFETLREKYLLVIKFFINNLRLMIPVLLSICILIFILIKITPTGFLPEEDRGALFVQVQLPDGATLYRTTNLVNNICEQLSKINGVYSVLQINGFAGNNTAFVVLKLEPWKKRSVKKASIDNIIIQVRKITSKATGAISFVSQPPAITGMGMFGGFEYQLLDKGDRSYEEIYKEANNLINVLMDNSKFANVYTSFTSSLPQIILNIDDNKAFAQGVDVTEIYDTLSTQFGASYVNDFNKFGRVYRVYLQADSEYREGINDLGKLYVKNNYGNMLKLTSVANYEKVVGPYSITRFNMYPAITIDGNPRNGISSGTLMKEMEKVSNKILPDDIGYAWSGVSLQEKISEGQLIPILIMALIFVYLFLVALYESWTLPVSVLMIAPIAILGALFFIFITGHSLDIYAQVGLVMLVGLSTKQAILIIEFAKDEMEKYKKSYIEAALCAAKLRFRAVMMTNIAFLLGLLPLVFARGAGAGSRTSIGISVFGGMLFVAFLGTVLVPIFFVLENVLVEKIHNCFSKNEVNI